MSWNDPEGKGKCYSCHRGRTVDNTAAACTESGGTWNSTTELCSPYVNMTSNGHGRLVGPQWIRKYACYFCHNNTVDASGQIKSTTTHVNGAKDVVIAPQWRIVGRPEPQYEQGTKTCSNVYCHSDGTTNPEVVRAFQWNRHATECNSCHGHPRGSCSTSDYGNGIYCHDGRLDPQTGKTWNLPTAYGNRTSYTWPLGQEWKAAIPMFKNEGPGTARANSHTWHTETNFACNECHAATIKSTTGSCVGLGCHETGRPLPAGSMKEVAHLNAENHVNRTRDVVFARGGSYNPVTKTCSNTACHSGGVNPQWGGTRNTIICLGCHGTTGSDVDSFGFSVYSTQAKISLTEWANTGHGRNSGTYPYSSNPPAAFPGNPCWYCHDNTVVHNDPANPFRLRQHQQFQNRFEKECVYCHMSGIDDECLSCHDSVGSLAPQLSTLDAYSSSAWPDGTRAPRPDHRPLRSSCMAADCHYLDPAHPTQDTKIHNVGSGLWSAAQKDDVKNQYVMMGVCLKCHDDDSGGKCTQCHEGNTKYQLGFNPGTGYIKPQKARASSVHFGRKHYRSFTDKGLWKGGKFCWDCHDPHGDGNIYMIQSQVATTTDGRWGIPKSRAQVVFTRKQSGLDYAQSAAPITGPYSGKITGLCNVCHEAGSQHFRKDGGDSHNSSRICTACHEHRFTDSHAGGSTCSTCHRNKPVPRHSGFGLPRDCTKCHAGTINGRMDVMGQFNGTSHHVQPAAGGTVTNRHCYTCHWESTPEGLIDVRHHEGYNYRTYTTVKNAPVDLVVLQPGRRPGYYNTTTAIRFSANMVGTAGERIEVAKVTNHCLSCHRSENNEWKPFDDCKTPNQYAWDQQSVAARYTNGNLTRWGKYDSNGKYGVTKALSGHGNAAANQGGWDPATGLDGTIPNTRNGRNNVECFDCHSSHGSKVVGTTSSYVTFNGTRNGGNLKETQAGKGGYAMSYKASANTATGTVNPYNAGAGQCFDCHLTRSAGATPWGYEDTFGATAAVMGYKDTPRFGQGTKASTARFPYRSNKSTIVGGHLKASSFLTYTTGGQDRINGLCTPCHDPHGVSPTLGSNMEYAVPMLKGTWLSSPFREDAPPPDPSGCSSSTVSWGIEKCVPSVVTNYNLSTLVTQVWCDGYDCYNYYVSGKPITEDVSTAGGLCVQCHTKEKLTNEVAKDKPWKGIDRIHESVKGWGSNPRHTYVCSKCHQPHNSGLPRLMQTNCLDSNHRGFRSSGGQAWYSDKTSTNYHKYNNGVNNPGYPIGGDMQGSAPTACHASAPGNTGTWPQNQRWNQRTPW